MIEDAGEPTFLEYLNDTIVILREKDAIIDLNKLLQVFIS